MKDWFEKSLINMRQEAHEAALNYVHFKMRNGELKEPFTIDNIIEAFSEAYYEKLYQNNEAINE